jgi:hypothetical protein
LIAAVALLVIWRFRMPEPFVILACGAVGLMIGL